MAVDLIKNGTMDFDQLKLVNHFYDPLKENDSNVRRMWYIYCAYFLTKINKDWNTNMQPTRLRKKSFMFDHITTSDEAMTQWFLKIWGPKIEIQSKNGWPTEKKSKGDGEHELKAGLKDYVALHHHITYRKQFDQGAVALRWNDIFWEEMIKNHPTAFEELSKPEMFESDLFNIDNSDSIVVLPDVDDDNVVFEMLKKKKHLNAISESARQDGSIQGNISIPNVNFESINSTDIDNVDKGNGILEKSFNDSSEDEKNVSTNIQAHPI